MKKNIIYLFLATLAPIFALQSCGLEEPVSAPEGDGYIEFVARPVGYENKAVQTKSEANPFEGTIANCFLLLFDATTGNRISIHSIDPSLTTTPHIKVDAKGHSRIIACFLANVPSGFANDIIGTTKPSADVNPTATNNQYLNTAVLTGITYGSGNDFGKPLVDLDGAGGNAPVPCIPMFGIQGDIVLSTTSGTTSFQVPIYRLFSKVSIDLRVDLDDLGALNVLSESCYDLKSCTITNLPTAVSLYAPSSGNESSWAGINKKNNQYSSYFTTATASYSNKLVYNDDSISSNKSYTCDFYVPEYYLNPLTQEEYNQLSATDPELFPSGSYGSEMYKPLAYSSNKSPVFVKLTGTYKQIPGDMNLTYDIYLGENATNNYTLKRNTWYKNYIKIKGFSTADVDHRVTVSGDLGLVDIHGQVANCYIVSEPREYSFFAYKGAHKYSDLTDIDAKYKCTKGTSVKLLYKDSNLLLLNNDSFTVSDDSERGVKKITFTIDGAWTTWSGNIVIALVYTDESGNEQIEWSWHLWFVPQISIGTTGIVELGSHTMPNAAKSVMMNRNLGITSSVGNVSAEIGAYYKYGNKEPYFNASNNVAVSEGNSTAYKPYGGGSIEGYTPSWSSVKSVTDPCPPGYRVPSSDVWEGYNPSYSHSTNPYAFKFLDSPLVYYPYSGSLDSNNKQVGQTSEPYEHTMPADIVIPFNLPTKGDICLDLVDLIKSKEIRSIKYKYNVAYNVGYLFADDESLLKYMSSTIRNTDSDLWNSIIGNFTIESYQYREGNAATEWKKTGNLGFIPIYNYVYTGEVDWGDWKTMSGSVAIAAQTEYTTIRSRTTTYIENHDNNQSHVDYEMDIWDGASGCQVRCMKE